MKTLTTGLLGCVLLAGTAQADVFISVDSKGSYVLSNIHRPGRTYERVIHEPESSLVSLDQQPQMIARQPYAELVSAAATANELPAALLHAVIQAESAYDARARSAKGGGGLMQLMPDTAREMGVANVYDPKANIQGGAKYLNYQARQQQREGDAVDTTLLATDQQRSILHTLQASHPRKPIAYSPYGHRPAASGLLSLLGFNGERADPVTGHYLLGNGYRAFNPVLMRFNSSDSWSPFGKGGLNSYVYCLGDPINRYDPNGHMTEFIKAGLLRWRARAVLTSIKETGSFDFLNQSKIKHKLQPGVSAEQAVVAGKKIKNLLKFAGSEHLENEQFDFNLRIANREGRRLERMSGLPVTENPRLKTLDYLKVEGPEGVSGFSRKRISMAEKGELDASVPLNKQPALADVVAYGVEIRRGVKNHNRVGFDKEVYRLIHKHFIFP